MSNESEPDWPIVAPRIHDNGTSAGQLLDMYQAIWNSLDEVRARIKNAAPNPRDFEGVAMKVATKQHLDILRTVDGMQGYFEHIMDAIDYQLKNGGYPESVTVPASESRDSEGGG